MRHRVPPQELSPARAHLMVVAGGGVQSYDVGHHLAVVRDVVEHEVGDWGQGFGGQYVQHEVTGDHVYLQLGRQAVICGGCYNRNNNVRNTEEAVLGPQYSLSPAVILTKAQDVYCGLGCCLHQAGLSLYLGPMRLIW